MEALLSPSGGDWTGIRILRPWHQCLYGAAGAKRSVGPRAPELTLPMNIINSHREKGYRMCYAEVLTPWSL